MSTPSPSPLSRAWPHLRAILVAVHVFALFIMAFPAPGGGMKRSAWADPTVQAEFEAWTARFNGLGVDITQDELEDRLWEIGTGYTAARNKVLKPFRPYYLHFGTYQSWRMFVAPHRFPARLHIDVRVDGGEWEPIYVGRSAQHDWHRRQFDHDRMRAAVFRYSWTAYRRTYQRFVDWIAREAAADFPDEDEVRARYFKYRTLSPRQVRAGEPVDGKFQQEATRRLEEYR